MPRLELTLSTMGILARIVSRRGVIFEESLPLENADDIPEAIGSLPQLSSRIRPGTATRVVVTPPLVQLRAIAGLPRLSRRHLHGVVKTQAGKYFHRNGAPLITAVAVPRRKKAASKGVFASAIAEPLADAIVRGAAMADLRLLSIFPASAECPRGMNLLPHEERSRQGTAILRRARWMALAAATVWLVAGGIALVRLARTERRVVAELAALEAPTAALNRARAEMSRVVASISAIDGTVRGRGQLLRTVSDIVTALPDSAYLSSLELDRSGDGRLGGVAPRAARVLYRLTGGGGNATLEGQPIRQDEGGAPKESFTIRLVGWVAP